MRIFLSLQCFFIFTIHHLIFGEMTDPLPSWNSGMAKNSIVHFVEEVTDPTNPHYVTEDFRIAVFDMDGTLWVEQPQYPQTAFAKSSVTNPFENGFLSDDFFDRLKVARLLAVIHAGTPTDEYREIIRTWLAMARHPKYKSSYTSLVYQPMLEVIEYLHAHQFKTYIVTGSGQDFVRAFSKETFDINEECVIGTSAKVEYDYEDGSPRLLKLPIIESLNDKEGKVENIYQSIGKRPIAAFGNSDGDRQMLEWTRSGPGLRLAMLVHHDDSKREYAYDKNSKIGTFSNSLKKQAIQENWHIISMKNDWKTLFTAGDDL